jgi:hypothetical protein
VLKAHWKLARCETSGFLKDSSFALQRSAELTDIKGYAPFLRNGSRCSDIPVVAPQANFRSAAGTIKQHKIMTLQVAIKSVTFGDFKDLSF